MLDVTCYECGREVRFLTETNAADQVRIVASTWACPACGAWLKEAAEAALLRALGRVQGSAAAAGR